MLAQEVLAQEVAEVREPRRYLRSDKVVGEERLALMIEILPDMVPFDCGRKDTWNTCC